MTAPSFLFPPEEGPHEGTWLQWPHRYQYGQRYVERIQDTWVEICRHLSASEKVHFIAYDENHQQQILGLLADGGVATDSVDIRTYLTDDFWVRDNGPMFVYDQEGQLVVLDWGFNGWGQKADYELCNQIPSRIARDLDHSVIELQEALVLEGGSIEVDGHGTLMATKSSILNPNRNPGITQSEVESLWKEYMGIEKVIWLEGQAGLDITDQHIDGFARFAHGQYLVTLSEEDLRAFDVLPEDVERLYRASNREGQAYEIVTLPLTVDKVGTDYGESTGYRGTYCNYYVANAKVLVPIYQDPNDDVALQIIQSLYPDREVVGVDVRNVYALGGMIHCITQQQPACQ